MHCASCSLRIDGDLEEVQGIKSANTNFAKGESSVEFDESQVSVEKINEVIKNAGYTVVG